MIVRAVDEDNDWTYGAGKNNYKRDRDALKQNIKTRLQSFLGDCFFSLTSGIDWWNLLGAKDLLALSLAVNATVLNTQGVTGIKQSGVSYDPDTREVGFTYSVDTVYGPVSLIFQYDLNGLV